MDGAFIEPPRAAVWQVPPDYFVASKQISVELGPMYYYHGNGYLAGEPPENPLDPNSPDGRVRINGVPAQRRVIILEHGSLRCVADTISAPDGTWRVEWLRTDIDWVAVSFDPTGAYEAVIRSGRRAVPMY